MSRAMVDADRSLRGGRGERDRDARDVRRYPSPHDGDRYRDRDRYGDPLPRLSVEDIKRYEFLQRRREERERELSDLSTQVRQLVWEGILFESAINKSTQISVSDKQKLDPFTNTLEIVRR